MSFLAEDLLASIKKRSLAPISQNTFSDADLLRLATEELKMYVVPKLIAVREDFFLTYKDHPFVANKSLYPVDERAVGDSFKSIWRVDSSGKEWPLSRIDQEMANQYVSTGSPSSFYLMGDKVKVVPAPTSTGDSLRMYIYLRQSDLVKTNVCAKITAIVDNGASIEFTVDTNLSDSLSQGDRVDFQKAVSPFLLWTWDITIDAITTTSITVAKSAVIGEDSAVLPQVGDYICPRKQSNIPQIPEEVHALLAQRTTVKVLEALGDTRKLQIAAADLSKIESSVFDITKNRVETQPKKVRSRNSILSAVTGR